jgi:hypothetical protein
MALLVNVFPAASAPVATAWPPASVATFLAEAGGTFVGGPPSVPRRIAPTSQPAAVSDDADGRALAVSAGIWHTCAIRTDGRLACWGDDELGQLYAPGGTFIALDAGVYHTCAIRTDGRLACWGWNEHGVTGAPAGTYVAVSAGGDHNCAIRTNGTLVCWGSNEHGQLSAPSGTFVAVSAGGFHTCGIRTDGTIACWGWDEGGMSTPPPGTFTTVGAGHFHTCGIRTDGTLACWGLSDPAPSGTFSAVGGGNEYTCAIRTDRTITCWGLDEYGVTSPPAGEFSAIGTGYEHSCAIRTDGTLSCWGWDGDGQLTPRPTASIRSLPRWVATTSISLRWSARPALSPVTIYDIRYRRAKWNGDFGAHVIWRSGSTATSATFKATPGYTYCFAVRAHDASGAVSDWTDGMDAEYETCTAVALDDRSLSRSSGWTTGTGSAFYRSTYTQSSTYGAKLTRTGVVAQDLALVATTCRTCGWVRVYWNSRLIARINLYSDRRVDREIIPIVEWGSARRGTLTIRVSTADGGKAIIDGVVIDRF